MTAHVTTALKVVEIIAGRIDPMLPLSVGEVARELGASLSRTSRLCSELEESGLLEHGPAYGTYRVGRRVVELSGRAAAPFAKALRYALTFAANQTGETICLAAPSQTSIRVIATIESLWTLHAPAAVGELVEDDGSAISRAARSAPSDSGEIFESRFGSSAEIAVPVFDPSGACICVLAVRLPVNRLDQHRPSALKALQAGRLRISTTIEEWLAAPAPYPVLLPDDSTPSSLEAALRILSHLATRQDTVAGTARGAGLRTDRTQRLLDSCRRAGLVMANPERNQFRLSWAVQGWYRSAVVPTILERGSPLVASAATQTRTCAFITILKGMRSFTLVEELEPPGEGLRMSPWLGRAHPIVGSDGGPSLVQDLEIQEIIELFPPRYTRLELDRFLRRVRQVTQDGVLSMEAFDDVGMVSISAPVRDSSGSVTAAACLVGTTEYMRTHAQWLEATTKELAASVSGLLGFAGSPDR